MASLWVFSGAAAITAVSVLAQGSRSPAVTGLDHIPLAVEDLEGAVRQYRALGFALKPGRPHENGIQNQHVKFPDGTEIELITAPRARDGLTATYRRHLAAGDGPAFLALYAPVPEAVTQRLGVLTFPDTDPLRYVFFGQRNHAPTDRPQHFAHPNGAESLVAVWLAAGDLTAERGLLLTMGATMAEETVRVPEACRAQVARLSEGAVVLLPGDRQLVPGRKVVGATVRVRRVTVARQVLERAQLRAQTVESGSSIFLPPAITHGMWLELRE